MIYNVAKLAENGVGPEQYANLTDWQLIEIYGHERDSANNLVKPTMPVEQQPESYERDCAALLSICSQFAVPPDQREAKLQAIKAKWGVE